MDEPAGSETIDGDGRSAARVHVDMKLCQSHGMCTYAAPGVFELDDDDLLHYSEQVEQSEVAQVKEAIKACPARAIRLLG